MYKELLWCICTVLHIWSVMFVLFNSVLVLSLFSQLLLSGLTPVFVWAGRRLNITAEADCRRLHCALRDLSSLLQAVGRLAEFFTGDVFSGRFNDALAIVQRSVSSSFFDRNILMSFSPFALQQNAQMFKMSQRFLGGLFWSKAALPC